MDIELLEKINIVLKEFKRIDFSMVYHHKGSFIEVEYGKKNTKECVEFLGDLDYWLGYGDFNEFLISRDIFYNYSGWMEYENDDIILQIEFTGPFDDEFEEVRVNFDESFINTELCIPESIKTIPNFNIDNIYVCFDMEKDSEIHINDFFYYEDSYIEIALEQNQKECLEKYLKDIVNENIPSLNICFPCEQIWSVECIENRCEFSIETSPVKLKLNDIIP